MLVQFVCFVVLFVLCLHVICICRLGCVSFCVLPHGLACVCVCAVFVAMYVVMFMKSCCSVLCCYYYEIVR